MTSTLFGLSQLSRTGLVNCLGRWPSRFFGRNLFRRLRRPGFRASAMVYGDLLRYQRRNKYERGCQRTAGVFEILCIVMVQLSPLELADPRNQHLQKSPFSYRTGVSAAFFMKRTSGWPRKRTVKQASIASTGSSRSFGISFASFGFTGPKYQTAAFGMDAILLARPLLMRKTALASNVYAGVVSPMSASAV